MVIYQSEFSKTNLWQGSVLGTIAYAVWVMRHPDFSHEQSWDGINYNVQNTMGAYGTVTFTTQGVVAAFFDSHSPKSPFQSGSSYDLALFLHGMPEELLSLAQEETLQYLLQEYEGSDIPVITAAFWSQDDNLIAAEPWQEVLTNGAHLIQTQLLDVESAIIQWQINYNFSVSQVDLVRALFTKKIAAPSDQVIFSSQEVDTLMKYGAQGIDISRELFTDVGVTLL